MASDGLYLDAGQARALRSWFAYSERCGAWIPGSEPDVLTKAIAPLMNQGPWRVEDHSGGLFMTHVHGTRVRLWDSCGRSAHEICDLLNRGERMGKIEYRP